MNKIALITGATSGIGEGCARRFARGGYNLILTGRNTGKLEILKKELEAEGVEVLALAFDVRNREAAKKRWITSLRSGAMWMCLSIMRDSHVDWNLNMRAILRIGIR